MIEMPISIGKRWPNSRVPWHKRGSRGGKPKLTLYYLNEFGEFGTRSINKIQELITKPQIKKRRQFICLICGLRFIWLVKHEDDSVPCPNGCDSEIS